MQLDHITFVGPPIDDFEILPKLPKDIVTLLQQINGFIQFEGGLHVRGACLNPTWHSLRNAWFGEDSFQQLYPNIQTDDVPFAEDCMGDQFVLRDDQVLRLAAESGEVEPLAVSVRDFLNRAQAEPVEYLSMQPLLQFRNEGGKLEPNQLLAAFPPFVVKGSANRLHLAAISAMERRRFLADLAAQIRDVPDGGAIEFKIVNK